MWVVPRVGSCSSHDVGRVFLWGDGMADTELLYLSDSYLREFDAEVVDVQDQNVVLSRTAFFPRGGGQMSDRGTLQADGRTWNVISVEKRGDVFHTVEGEPPPAGTHARGLVDWD